jgi:ATP-dependent Lon protease
MARDNQNKLSKKEQIKRSKRDDEKLRNKKKNEESDSDNGEDESGDEMDVHEYRKFLSKIFPSKHLSNKIKAGEKIKDKESENKKEYFTSKNKKYNKKGDEDEEDIEEDDWETDSEEDEEPKKKTNKKNKNNKRNKIVVSESESEDETLGSEDTEDDEDDEDYEEEEDEDEEEIEVRGKGSNKLNIIFTIGGTADEDEDEEWIDEDDEDFENYVDSDEETEDEDASVSSSSSSEEEEVLKKSKKGKKVSDKKENKKEDTKKKDKKEISTETTTNNDKNLSNETFEQLKQMLEKNPNDKSIKKCIEVYEADIKKQKAKQEKKDKKHKEKNMRIFRKIVKDKNTMNDFSFYEKLELDNQKKLIKELREINKITRIEKPYRMTLLESNIPVEFKAAAMKKVNSLRYMEPGSGEFYKIKNWVDTFMKIPFTNYQALPISIEDGVDKCHEFMENAQKTLENAVYGLNDAKMQIMQMLGQLLTNPKAIGSAIAIHGPPGTGKTSIIKEGISKILNRPFAFIALGGATDSSFLEGHGYTYEGSTWGKIVQILIDSKCMNPVIYFDELDKISDTPRGEEITGILTHLTDTTQNSQFHDKYFAEINFDLSKCLFIFSYNDESKVNPILKDRMYRIKTKGYSGKEKTVIAKNYLMPKIREQVKFNDNEIIISDEVLSYINENHCNKEDGVRNMKRCLEIIHTKINLYRLMKPGTNLFEGEMSLKVEFPFVITKNIVDKLIKKESDGLETWRSLYV